MIEASTLEVLVADMPNRIWAVIEAEGAAFDL